MKTKPVKTASCPCEKRISHSIPGRSIQIISALVLLNLIALAQNQDLPKVTGTITLISSYAKPEELLKGTVLLDLRNIKRAYDFEITLIVFAENVDASVLLLRSGINQISGMKSYRFPSDKDRKITLQIENEFEIKAPVRAGKYTVEVICSYSETGVPPDPFSTNYSQVCICLLDVVPEPEEIKEIKIMEKPWTDPGGPFYEGDVFKFYLKYLVKGLPKPPAGQTTPPVVTVNERIEVLRLNKTSDGKERWTTEKSAVLPRDASSSNGKMERQSGLKVHNYPAGSYKIKFIVESRGYVYTEGEFPFEILARKTTALPEPTGTSWGLKEILVDPGKISNYDPAWKSVTATAATCIFERGGITRQLNVNVSGTPPGYLQPGSKFDISITVSASPKVQEGFLHAVGAGVVGTDIIKIEHDPPGPDDRVFAGWKGLREDEWIPSATMTYHCSVPSQVDYNSWPAEISFSPFIGGTGLMATYVYKQGEKPKDDQGKDNSGKAGIDDASETLTNLSARFQTETIELVPGEVSKQNGIYVSGWRSNTSDRVEVKIRTIDGFGSLEANPAIVVNPGPTSGAPGNMSNAGVSDKNEYFFPENWSARSAARTGEFRVPVVVRQAGLAPVNLTLNIRIVSAGKITGGKITGPPVTHGITENGLEARLQCATLDLFPGEVSQSCDVFVSGWNSFGDRVELIFPQSANGILPGGIIVFPGNSSETPANMFNSGVADNKEYPFQEMFRAAENAPSGSSSIDIIVRQPGMGFVSLRLQVNVLRPGITLSEKDPADIQNKVAQLLNQQNYAEAINILQKSISEFPFCAEYYAGLGGASSFLGKYVEALAAINKAIELQPNNSEFIVRKAWTYTYTGNWKEAEQTYKEAIMNNPAIGSYYSGLGKALEYQGKYQEAIEYYKKGLQVDPSNAGLYYLLGNTYGRIGKFFDAENSFKEAIRMNANDFNTWFAWGNNCYNQQKYNEAEYKYREAIRLNPSNGEFHANLAGVLFVLNRKEEAIVQAQEAIRLGFRNHWVYDPLGIVRNMHQIP